MKAKTGNGITVAGTVTRDAETKVVGDKGTPLAVFGLAIGTREEAEYVDIKAFGKLAAYAGTAKKGDAVCAMGTLDSRVYNGKTYYSVKCQWLNIVGAPVAPAPHPPVPDGLVELDDEEEVPL